jgi:hypothetical protein
MRKRLGVAGRNRILERFSWKDKIDALLQALERGRLAPRGKIESFEEEFVERSAASNTREMQS